MKFIFTAILLLATVGVVGVVNSSGQDHTMSSSTPAVIGRTLFLKNCAHCHADDATGDEGPDLHGLKRSNDWIAKRIRNGIKGEMTAFGEKFSQTDIDALIAYLHTLK